MFYNILKKKSLAILPLLGYFNKDFYLAGGTGLALQLGHRDSVDFDFFSLKDFKASLLWEKIQKHYKNHKLSKVQQEENTLTIILDDVKLSFFSYPYKLVNKLIEEKYLKIASIEDIACMKLGAITSRATNKDYVDLYFILKKISLNEILSKLIKKMPSLDISLVLKSLIYFKDIVFEPIRFKNQKDIDFKSVKDFFKKEIKKFN